MWVREHSFFSIYEKRIVVMLIWDLSPEYNSFPKWVVNMNHNAISDLGSRETEVVEVIFLFSSSMPKPKTRKTTRAETETTFPNLQITFKKLRSPR
jgi:hypothetical protein